MFPHALFWGISLYDIMITVGILACFVTIRLLSDRRHMPAKWQNFVLADALVAIAVGYPVSIVTQAFYNIKNVGRFVINTQTGATFFGGLVGGAATFILVYFTVGKRRLGGDYTKKSFRTVSDIAACGIAVAHGFGRLGCLCAGCCGGKPTDAWYGITMASGRRIVPIQLFEALFLFALFAFLFIRFWRGKGKTMPIYMTVYGVWRFFIEYARGDERGHTIVSFLTPSQLTAILLFVGGVVIFLLERRADKRAALAGAEDKSCE